MLSSQSSMDETARLARGMAKGAGAWAGRSSSALVVRVVAPAGDAGCTSVDLERLGGGEIVSAYDRVSPWLRNNGRQRKVRNEGLGGTGIDEIVNVICMPAGAVNGAKRT